MIAEVTRGDPDSCQGTRSILSVLSKLIRSWSEGNGQTLTIWMNCSRHFVPIVHAVLPSRVLVHGSKLNVLFGTVAYGHTCTVPVAQIKFQFLGHSMGNSGFQQMKKRFTNAVFRKGCSFQRHVVTTNISGNYSGLLTIAPTSVELVELAYTQNIIKYHLWYSCLSPFAHYLGPNK